MCARPVQESVTVIVGHEKVRNSSNDSKRTPHERSYLSKAGELLQSSRIVELTCVPTMVHYVVGNNPYRPSTPGVSHVGQVRFRTG